MVMKKLGVFAGVLFLMILFLGVASAVDDCIIKPRSLCIDNNDIVMGLSSLPDDPDGANAHGELWDQADPYDYVLCCDLEYQAGYERRGRDCSDHIHPVYGDSIWANKIIGLSSATNAHAEITGKTDYEPEVCYENLACISTEENCGPDYFMKVLSLTDSTNAHIGAYGDYDTKICCKQIECRVEVNYCSDYDRSDECDYDPCKDKDVAGVSVSSDNPDIDCEEYDCYCEWSETESECGPRWDAVPFCGDGRWNDEGESCDGNPPGNYDWGPITNCEDLVPTLTGGDLSCTNCRFDISQCTGGIPEGSCGDNITNNFPFETCDNESLSGKTCEDFGLLDDDFGLVCYPPEHVNNCTFDITGCMPLETYTSKIGKCNYNENTDDNCDDTFLTYNWTATWTWGEDNPEHYDPDNAAERCVGGSNTVPCPAQIQLPFFGSYSIVVIFVLIALIYVILTLKKKKFDSKGKVKKK